MTAVENEIPNVSGLDTKTDYNTKINEIEKKIPDHGHDKYTTTSEFNKLTTQNFKARLAHTNLVRKTDLDTELQDISNRITSNKSKHLLVENKLKKLKTFDSPYLKGKDNFEEDYLVFKPMYKYVLKMGSTKRIAEWKSK